MKVVLDTNVLVSARVFGGKPRQILELITLERTLTGVSSQVLLDEYLGVLREKFSHDEAMLQRIKKVTQAYFEIVSPQHIPSVITYDPPDNQVLAVTHETTIDFIISGDNDLLTLKEYNGISIVTPDTFLKDTTFLAQDLSTHPYSEEELEELIQRKVLSDEDL